MGLLILLHGCYIETCLAFVDLGLLANSATMFSLLLAFYYINFLFHASSAVQPTVDLGYSKYEGVALPNGVSQWLGIRFASPPLDGLRFRAPVDPPRNTTLQIASEVFKFSHLFFRINETIVAWTYLFRNWHILSCIRRIRRLLIS